MSMAELIKKIEDMGTYSNQAMYARDERWKVNQYKFKIRGEIGHNVSQQKFDTYVALLQQWYIAENNLKNICMDKYQA